MIKVNTHFILANSFLRPFIKYFAVRKFDTDGIAFSKVITAEHEMMISFHMHCKVFDFEEFDKKTSSYVVDKNSTADCCFSGVQTSTKGFVVYNGQITLLTIHFTPIGFFFLFNITPKELVDKIGDTKNILSREVELLHEEIHGLKDLSSCIALLETYLAKKLMTQKTKYKHIGIMGASDFLMKQKGTYSIKRLASDCNMTMQTFEVQFEEQVGVNPKYYSRILRLNSAISLKVHNSFRSWTDIAYACGYYDQMHLIKDFKNFTSLSPLNFMKEMHPPLENFQNKED